MFNLEERTTRGDVIAGLALLISMIAILTQFYHRLIGNQVTLLPLEQVIFHIKSVNKMDSYVDVISTQTYINHGARSYGEPILRERAVLQVGNDMFALGSLNLVSLHGKANNRTYRVRGDYKPFILSGKSIESHMTQFVSIGAPKASLTPLVFLEAVREAEENKLSIEYSVSYRRIDDFSEAITCKIDPSLLLERLSELVDKSMDSNVDADKDPWVVVKCSAP
ncbi:MAG: hypothetical protein V3T17_08520 [Pseudomonadales bacterium]